MMRKFIGIFTLLGLVFSPMAYAHEVEDEVYYTEDDDELFNHGKFVGQENDDYKKWIRKEQSKNWAIALTSAAASIATVILVKRNYDK